MSLPKAPVRGRMMEFFLRHPKALRSAAWRSKNGELT